MWVFREAEGLDFASTWPTDGRHCVRGVWRWVLSGVELGAPTGLAAPLPSVLAKLQGVRLHPVAPGAMELRGGADCPLPEWESRAGGRGQRALGNPPGRGRCRGGGAASLHPRPTGSEQSEREAPGMSQAGASHLDRLLRR